MILLWLRRDLRLHDHPALHEAARAGRPVIPVLLRDEVLDAEGAATRFRLGLSAAALARSLDALGSRLVTRRGRAAAALLGLARETGATAVWWTRLHDPASRARDAEVEAMLAREGVAARSFPGHLVVEPGELRSASGGAFRVQAAFLRALRRADVGRPLPAPARLPAPEAWPAGEPLALEAALDRGAAVVGPWQEPGEEAARARLDAFLGGALRDYATARDVPSRRGSSRLSEHLATGEVSARAVWVAARASEEPAAEAFGRELAWRDFCHHMLREDPSLPDREWRPDWRGFPWRRGDGPEAEAWRRARTGVPLVDAGLREMYVTGRMHNRVRMVVASFLCKHLLTDWRAVQGWFAECLTDWDPANNAVNWQWVAGTGPDAAPYFRNFNPLTQAREHDPEGAYVRAWVAEGQADPPATALSYFDAVPRAWRLAPDDPYPAPVVDLAAGRARALEALRRHRAATA